MIQVPEISKLPTAFKSMDFAFLRSEGIRHLEKKGSRLWTDYNLHDPGITILEVLCYAITDLGYRTNFAIEDIIAEPGNGQKQFFGPLKILPCNPVTPNDFRKILIDIKGIKNAWLFKTVTPEVRLYGNDTQLSYTSLPNGQEIMLNGLYDVYIDLEDDINQDDEDIVNDIIQCAWQQLWKHRNLCEDFVRIALVREMPICMDVQIELCPDADVNIVAGEIYFRVQQFLTPTIQFYNFTEMQEKKMSCEEIFEGPVLCNGFIDEEELNQAQLRSEVYVSDLWQVIMDVCGVAAIKKLVIRNAEKENEITGKQKWCISVPDFYKPVIDVDCSKLSFQREFECVFPDERKLKERITLLKKLNQPKQKSMAPPTLVKGMDRNLAEYFTIQNEFPSTYKIGPGQLVDSDPIQRKAQVKQLKGYLMLYDQLLANYLVQLSGVKDLLSATGEEEHTYFYQTLYSIPGVKELISAFPAAGSDEDWDAFAKDSENAFIKQLEEIIETETRQKQRRNIFLDHLLARFGESFSEYVLKVYEEQCSCSAQKDYCSTGDEVLIKRKATFLSHIPELSSERGKGFNYKGWDCDKPDVWDTANVSGLKKRVSMYMGFESYNRRTLTCPPEFDIVPYRLITDGRVQSYRLRLQDKNETVLLDGLKDYRLASNATKDAKDLREQILKGKLDLSTPEKGYSRVYVNDRENNRALQSEMLPEREADELKQRILQLAFPEECNIEGFHIVEHILLRPGDDDFSLMTPIPVPDMLAIKYNQVPTNLARIPEESIFIADPYSFWITVIAPAWLPQFRQNKNAQHRFEQLVRREAPAHIAVKFCWLPAQEMYAFETRYLKWLYENALPEPNERELTEHANNLLEELGKCSYTIRPIDNPCSSENVGETNDSIHNT